MKAKGIHFWQAFCLLIATLAISAAAPAGQAPVAPRYAAWDVSNPSRVDIALVLAVDVSSSIEAHERRFQRQAYAEALRDPRVAQMALGGGSGRVAIAYMEWSGRRHQRVHLPMRIMSTPAELSQFGADVLAIEDRVGDPMFVQPTALGNALMAAEDAMAALEVPARDYIVDISGDGVLNDGETIRDAREHVLSMGLTVNGLPIEVAQGLSDAGTDGYRNVSRYYMDCVIGGPGAFHLVARGFGDVRETLIMKLMLEMADLHPEQKTKIAQAWNEGQLVTGARIIPAMVLDLSPVRPTAPQTSDCENFR